MAGSKNDGRRLKAEGGLWLQSANDANLCLAAAEPNLRPGSQLVFAACDTVPTQIFSSYAGNLGLNSHACLRAPDALGEPVSLAPCACRAEQQWGLDVEDGALYSEVSLAGAANTTLIACSVEGGGGGQRPTAGLPIVSAAYDGRLAVPLKFVTPHGMRGQRLFWAKDPNYCLVDQHRSVGVALCAAEARNQIWRLDDFAIRSHDHSCLTVGDGNQDIVMRTCRGRLRQTWELSYGLLVSSALRDSPLANAMSVDSDTNQVVIGPGEDSASHFSVGWPLHAGCAL